MRYFSLIICVSMCFASAPLVMAEDIMVPVVVPGDEDSITLIENTGGGVAVLSKSEKELAVSKQREDVAPDTTPRKARLGVVPAVYSQGVRSKFKRELYEQFGIAAPGVIENPGFTGHLVDSLVNSHKFEVLEREDLRSVIKEIDFGESDYADLAKVVQMGQMLNADYMVLPEIQFIIVKKEEKPVPYIGKTRLKYRGKLSDSIRVVSVKTSQIVSSSFSEQTIEYRPSSRDHFPETEPITFINKLYQAAAMEDTARIIEIAYPVKIVAILGDTVTINRGKGAAIVGEIFDVYKPGEVIIDPDTKETLDYVEEMVGKIQVTEVGPKMSKARIINGTDKIGKLYLCRRQRDTGRTELLTAPKLD